MKFEFKVTLHYGLWTKCTQLWPLNNCSRILMRKFWIWMTQDVFAFKIHCSPQDETKLIANYIPTYLPVSIMHIAPAAWLVRLSQILPSSSSFHELASRGTTSLGSSRCAFLGDVQTWIDSLTRRNSIKQIWHMMTQYWNCLKFKSTFSQGHFLGRNWIVVSMKINEKCLKNSVKPIFYFKKNVQSWQSTKFCTTSFLFFR